MSSSTSPQVTQQPGACANTRRYLALLLLTAMLTACGGGGGNSAVAPSAAAMTVVKGQVVDDFVAGATVNAYQVNADGTRGALIAGPFTTDQNGNYSLKIGDYTGPVYLTSTGGTYTNTATGQRIVLTEPPWSWPNQSERLRHDHGEITPMTTMAAQLVQR